MVEVKDMNIFDIRLKYDVPARVFYALANSPCRNATEIVALTENEILSLPTRSIPATGFFVSASIVL